MIGFIRQNKVKICNKVKIISHQKLLEKRTKNQFFRGFSEFLSNEHLSIFYTRSRPILFDAF